MPTATLSTTLAANIDALRVRNPALADLLLEVEPRADLECVPSAADHAAPAVKLAGIQLCSRHDPLAEGRRLVQDIDLVQHAVVLVLGFAAGYHVQALAQRANKATLILVFEPDLPLLRAVLENIDHSRWLRSALVLFFHDPADRAAVNALLKGAEPVVCQGVHLLEHPPSRTRLGSAAPAFTATFNQYITSAKTTLATTLVRSVDTVRNLILNLDHYAAGEGIAPLRNFAQGFPAVIVSAGPSLHRNLHLLADPAVREKFVIIAVQTVLKPMLNAGIKPHFVTALDYHEISRRFYEDLDPASLHDVTLVIEPKVNPAVPDAYPGPLRCCASDVLDRVLGPSLRRPMGDLPAGATVAHLALYLAQFLGCTSIALIGQDLGFSDGLYYAPNAAIHDIWATELNPFNTLAMMEWQRIVRHRLHLHKTADIHGRSIYTDAQMLTYLQQFERDFAQCKSHGITIVDATEGGVAKQHALALPLSQFLAARAGEPLPPFPVPLPPDSSRLPAIARRVSQVRADVLDIQQTSRTTASLLNQLLDHHADAPRAQNLLRKIDQQRARINARFESFQLLQQMNQMAVFRRFKADRAIHMHADADPAHRLRAQLQRDLSNVTWIADGCDQMLDLLASARTVLQPGSDAPPPALAAACEDSAAPASADYSRVAAVIAFDPAAQGLQLSPEADRTDTALHNLLITLHRLDQSSLIHSLLLILPHDFDPAPFAAHSFSHPLIIEHATPSAHSPFGPEHRAIAAARLFAPTCWRGGIAGMSVFDEALAPHVMLRAMLKHAFSAALVVGADWVAVQTAGESGCDALVRRHLQNPAHHRIVFNQSPPGLAGCVISQGLMQELAARTRLCAVGPLLVYQPHAPQPDPIARDANVQVPQPVRQGMVRLVADTPASHSFLASIRRHQPSLLDDPAALVSRFSDHLRTSPPPLPAHIILELTTRRNSTGIFALERSAGLTLTRPDASLSLISRLRDHVPPHANLLITLSGAGDPLLHPHVLEIISQLRAFTRAIHLRTELLLPQSQLPALLSAGIDIISIDLNADRAATYSAMMGLDRFKDVLLNIQSLAANRTPLSPHPGNAAFALPWIIPRLQRRAETFADIESFYDRWVHTLGAALIDSPTAPQPPPACDTDPLTPAVTPPRACALQLLNRLTILSDGSVPVSELDLAASQSVGNILQSPLPTLWSALHMRRLDMLRSRPPHHPSLSLRD